MEQGWRLHQPLILECCCSKAKNTKTYGRGYVGAVKSSLIFSAGENRYQWMTIPYRYIYPFPEAKIEKNFIKRQIASKYFVDLRK